MRAQVQSTARSALVALLAVLATIVLAIATTISAAITLTATTALIVPGTGTPNPGSVGFYEDNARDYYIETTTALCQPTCATEGVPYIAQFWPFPFPGWGGLSGAKWNVSVASGVAQLTSDLIGTYNPTPDDQVVVFGYSQGATVASLVKRNLSQLTDDQKQNVAFVLIGNPNRPNGGLFERLALLGTVPILDATFGQPTPTNTGIKTTDIAFQYDGVSDFPTYPINLLADLNAIAGFAYIHGTYLAPNANSDPGELPNGLDPAVLESTVTDIVANCATDPRCQTHGDTTYVTIPTPNLPLLQPLRDLGAATHLQFITTPLVDLVQPALRVLIETGYNRGDYGKPTPFRLIPIFNPITVTVDFVDAVGEGIGAALNDIGHPTSAVPPAPSPLTGPNTQSPTLRSVGDPPPSQDVSTQKTVDDATQLSLRADDSDTAASADSDGQKLASVTELPKAPKASSTTKPTRPLIRGPIGTEVKKVGQQVRQTIAGTLSKLGIHPRTSATAKDAATSSTPAGDASPGDNTSDSTSSKSDAAA